MSCQGPACNTSSSKQQELKSRLEKLREQKDELEIKLNGQSCTPDPTEEQLEASKCRLAQAIEEANRLKALKAEMEGKVKCLEGRSLERSDAIYTLSQFAEEEKNKLRGQVEEVTKVLKVETEGRITAQDHISPDVDTCPLAPPAQNNAPPVPVQPTNPFHVEVDQGYAYPYDATVERPARYVRDHLRQNPIRPIPFPNAAMDEAEALGGNCNLNY